MVIVWAAIRSDCAYKQLLPVVLLGLSDEALPLAKGAVSLLLGMGDAYEESERLRARRLGHSMVGH